MFAYYRSLAHGTIIQKILKGSISNQHSSDLVLVKGNSFEWMSIRSITESDPNILVQELQQSTFGLINDAQILSCQFEEESTVESYFDNLTVAAGREEEEDVDKDIPYFKKVRKHCVIQGSDVMVVLSEYGKLVFMTIESNPVLGTRRFETLTEIRLESPGIEYTKIGKKLAVDPHSRAIAISSFQDRFDILILNNSMSRTVFDPVKGRCPLYETGIIWHMEFLYTETTSMDRILLALVVYNDIEKLCRIVMYAIDASDPNNVVVEKLGRLPLEKNTPLPLLLIPLRFQSESFLLVTEQQVSLLTAEDITCGNVLYPSHLIPRQFGSTECPLFTTCASHINYKENYVYLGSAEGHIYKLMIQFSTGDEFNWIAIEKITNPISQSMCVLGTIDMMAELDKHSTNISSGGGKQEKHLSTIKADVVLYAGENANSQIIAIPHKTQLQKNGKQGAKVLDYTVVQELVNRAPLINFIVADNFQGHGQDALIACTGQGKDGSLSIVTHGIEAIPIESSKSEWKGISRLWSLKASGSKEPHLLLASSSFDSRLLSAKNGHVKDITSLSEIEFDCETIHSDNIVVQDYNRNLLLQVYPHGLSIADINYKNYTHTIAEWKPSVESSYRIELATSWQCPENDSYCVAMCIVTPDNAFTLQIVNVVVTVESSSNSSSDMEKGKESCLVPSSLSLSINEMDNIPIVHCPSYIGYFNVTRLQQQQILIVGTFEPSLLFFNINSKKEHSSFPTITLVQEIKLSSLPPGTFAVPHSAGFLNSTLNAQIAEPLYLLVGLRQGTLLSFKVSIYCDNGKIIEESKYQPSLHDVGLKAIQITPYYQSALFVLSEHLWRFTCCPNTNRIEMEHVSLPTFSKTMDTFAFLDCDVVLSSKKRPFLAVIADDRLHMFQLGLKSQINTRKIALEQTPKKVLYDKTLNYIIAITSFVDSFGKRNNFTRLLDPSNGHPLSDSLLIDADIDYGKNDLVLSAAEWSVQNQHKTYKYLCIGLGHSKIATSPLFHHRSSSETIDRGSLVLYRLKARKSTSSGYFLKRLWLQKKPGGVYAICPHSAGLLFSAGVHLYLYQLENGQLKQVAHLPLHSLIKSIHQEGNRICVACQNESVSFYEFNPETNTIDFLKGDVTTRTIHHSLILNNRLAVVSDQAGGMIGLYDNVNNTAHQQRLESLFSFHYSDILIEPSLARLRSQHSLNDFHTNQLSKHLVSWDQKVGSDHQQPSDDEQKLLLLTANSNSKPIIACTIPGGIVQVYRIGLSLYMLLSAIQNIMIHQLESAFSPLLLGSAQDFEWFCQLSTEKEKDTIHGDLVESFLRLSMTEQLSIVRNRQGVIRPELISIMDSFGLKSIGEENCSEKDAILVIDVIKSILLDFEKYQ